MMNQTTTSSNIAMITTMTANLINKTVLIKINSELGQMQLIRTSIQKFTKANLPQLEQRELTMLAYLLIGQKLP